MNRRRLYTLFSLLTTLSLLAGLSLPHPTPVLAQDTPPTPNLTVEPGMTASTPETSWLWTRWSADQYALAEDDHSLWIGGAGSILRWDKTSRTYRRYGSPDGIPHTSVYAVAVDEDGNRWFGGDGGLSQLDANEQWHHYTTQNSGLHSNLVTGIAIGADGTLWFDHGHPGGVSRRLIDDSWQWFPNLAAVIEADSERILQTLNTNSLWTISGDEIWHGYFVYKDGRWIDRTPSGVPTQPHTVVAGASGHVWVLPEIATDVYIYHWNGESWLEHSEFHNFNGRVTALTASIDGTVWFGWADRGGPYGNEFAGYNKLGGDWNWIEHAAPVAALLPSDVGVWAIGPSWLVEPDGTLQHLPDLPLFSTVSNAVLDGDGLVWLHSQHIAPYRFGVMQTLADQGDPILVNDQWAEALSVGLLSSIERTIEGDLWLAPFHEGRFGYFVDRPLRSHQGTWVEYKYPEWLFAPSLQIIDIFAQDEHHTWFAYGTMSGRALALPQGVFALDDGGTVDDFTDDVWSDYPIETSGEGGSVAVDSLGRLWFGDSSGLYLYQQDTWQPFRLDSYRPSVICDLTPAPNGVLFVQIDSSWEKDGCDYADAVYAIQPEGNSDFSGVGRLLREQYELVRSTLHRNRLWTVAPDGAVWYMAEGYPLDDNYVESPTLFRHNADGSTRFQLPFDVNAVASLEVDANNHVWLVAEESLWRLSPPPRFELSVLPVAGMLEIGAQQSIPVQVTGRGGFTGTVSLALADLPEGITATLDRSEVPTGEDVIVKLTIAPSVAAGTYTLRVDGTSGALTDSLRLAVQVVAELFLHYLPALSR